MKDVSIAVQPKSISKSHPAKSLDGDRRRYVRSDGVDLLVNINGRLVEVLDISLSGLRISNGFPVKGDKVEFSLIPRDGNRLDVNNSVPVKGTLVRHIPEEHAVAIKFERVTYSLSKMIIAAISRKTGVKPYHFG